MEDGMIKLAICDDDPKIVEQLETYIEKMNNRRIEYDVFGSAEDLRRYLGLNHNYNLYILDIEMDGMTGLELAKVLRNEHLQSLIVFLTSYSQYVYDVFEVVTFDFIVKPITFEKFEKLIVKAENYLNMTYANFVFSYRKNNFSVPCNMIYCIEKQGRKALIHELGGNIYQTNMTLKEIWEQLDERVFVEIHTSCIINLAEVISIEGERITMRNKESFFVSRNYRQRVKKQHLLYLKDLI